MKSKKTTKKGKNSQNNGARRYPLRSSRDGVRVLRSMSNEKTKVAPESSSAATNPALAKRKKKRKVKSIQINELSLIRKRVRYMLTRMNYEQSLIDAYSSEGWKGLSLEKIRPEKELERAKSEILRCKIRIRDAFRHLETLLLEGKIEDSLFDSKGEIDSEDIFCSKCGSKELSADNDIILCDGCCDRAFHQKCVDPPLETEKIPPEEEGWFCPGCVCKFDCLELLNEFNEGDLSIEDSWEKVFPEAAMCANGDKQLQDSSFPSDDSEDNDYNPDVGESDTDDQNDASCSEGSDSTSLSEKSEPSNQKRTYDYLGLPSEDSEDDDYDPECPNPCKGNQKEGPSSDGSDFTSDSDDFCTELCKVTSNNEVSKFPDDSGDAKYTTEKCLPGLESDPGQGNAIGISGKRDFGYKNPYDETYYGKSSSCSSDDEDWAEKTTPKKVKRDGNQQGISVMRETRSRSTEKRKSLSGGKPKREEDHIVGQPPLDQIQVTPRVTRISSKVTCGKSSLASSGHEDLTEKTTPKKTKKDQQESSVVRQTRSRSLDKQKSLSNANPSLEEDHTVGQPALDQIQVTPRITSSSKRTNKNSIRKHDGSITPISNTSKSESSVQRKSSQERSQKLHECFKENQYPSRQTKERLSEELGMTSKQVDKWFENTRRHFKHCATKKAVFAGPSMEDSARNANRPGYSIEVPTVEKHNPETSTDVYSEKRKNIMESSRKNTKSDHEAMKSSDSNGSNRKEKHNPETSTDVYSKKRKTIMESSRKNTKFDHKATKSSDSNGSNRKVPNKARNTKGSNVQLGGDKSEIKEEIDSERRKAIARELRRMRKK